MITRRGTIVIRNDWFASVEGVELVVQIPFQRASRMPPNVQAKCHFFINSVECKSQWNLVGMFVLLRFPQKFELTLGMQEFEHELLEKPESELQLEDGLAETRVPYTFEFDESIGTIGQITAGFAALADTQGLLRELEEQRQHDESVRRFLEMVRVEPESSQDDDHHPPKEPELDKPGRINPETFIVELTPDNKVRLSWEAPTTGGPATDYDIEYREHEDASNTALSFGNRSSTKKTAVRHEKVTPGRWYLYRVRGRNAKGDGPWTEAKSEIRVPALPPQEPEIEPITDPSRLIELTGEQPTISPDPTPPFLLGIRGDTRPPEAPEQQLPRLSGVSGPIQIRGKITLKDHQLIPELTK